MAYLAGQTITDFISLTDSNGTAITGATLTVVSAVAPGNGTFTPVITEIGSGAYKIEITTSTGLDGQWFLWLRYAGPPVQNFTQTYDVDSPVGVAVGVSTLVGGTTLLTLRRQVGERTGDVLICTASEAGTTSSFIDLVRAAVESNSLTGRLARFSAGTTANLGADRRVTGNTKATGTVSVSPALSAATAVGDGVELWNERDAGALPDQVDRWVNEAIAAVAGQAGQEVLATVGTNFDANAPVLALATTWRSVNSVDWQDADSLWHPIPPDHLRVDRAGRTIEVIKGSRYIIDGYAVRIRGQAEPAQLTTDTDATTVDGEWIVYQAAAWALHATAHRRYDSADARALAQAYQGRADTIRPKVRRLQRRGTVRL